MLLSCCQNRSWVQESCCTKPSPAKSLIRSQPPLIANVLPEVIKVELRDGLKMRLYYIKHGMALSHSTVFH